MHCQAKIKKIKRKEKKMKQNIEELIRQERLKYFRNWRKNNKDKVKQHNKNFWLKKIKQEEQKSGN